MILRHIDDLKHTDREVETPNWVSRRLLLAKEGMGFSLHETEIRAGTRTSMWYKNHVEAVYCIAGEGEIKELPDGPVHSLRVGSMYALDGHEKHELYAKTNMKMVCVFNPPCTGREVHGEDGAYPLLTEAGVNGG